MSTSAPSELNLDIWLQPKQLALWHLVDESPFLNIGYGGRRGGGKSGGVRRILILRRLKYAETNGIILRRTYKELFQNHIEPLFREYPVTRDWWVEKHKYIDFPNGSKLYFGYAEHEKDVEDLFGSEFGDIAAEEAGLFRRSELEKMRGSCRWQGVPGFRAKMIYSFMPRGLSHFYLKRVFVDKEYEGVEKPSDFTFLEAFGWDNVKWVEEALREDGMNAKDFYSWDEEARKAYFLARSDYARQLLSISDEGLRNAWLEGDWGSFEGLVFPELKESLHDLDQWMPKFKPVAEWRREFEGIGCKLISAIDWADSGQTGAEECAIDEHENMFFFDEYAARNRTVKDHTASVLGMLKEHGRQEYTLMDLPVNNINQDELFSIQQAFELAGLRTTPAHRANISIGLDLLKQCLRIDKTRIHPFTKQRGSPRIFISKSRCPSLWRQMKELQQMVDSDTGKVSYVGEDDNLDPARYIAMSRPQAPRVPVSVAVDRKLIAYAEARGKEVEDLDLNTVHMLHRQATLREQELRKRNQRGGGRGRVWRPRS